MYPAKRYWSPGTLNNKRVFSLGPSLPRASWDLIHHQCCYGELIRNIQKPDRNIVG